MTRALFPVLAAFGLLTRIPVGTRAFDSRDLGRAAAFFPLVGLALAALVGGAAAAIDEALPRDLEAALLVALLALVTGAIHLDGLADLADGLGGSRGDRARALEIMRDSRIGAFGAVAIALVVAVKILALGAVLASRTPVETGLFLVAARWAVVPLVVHFPPARQDGLGRSFHAGSHWLVTCVATGFAIPVALVGGRGAWFGFGAAVLVSLGIGLVSWRRLGGLTGDVHGAAIELAECAYLVAVVAAPV